MFDLLYFILIGLAAGWLAGRFMKRKNSSLWVDLAVGIIGAILGGFLLPLLGLTAVSLRGELVIAFVGAVLLIYLLRKLGKRM